MNTSSPTSRLKHWVQRLRAGGFKTPPLKTGASQNSEPAPISPPAPVQPGTQAVAKQPLLVFDLETSGLDMRRDTVLSIGAVRIENGAIPLAGHIDSVLQVQARLKRDSQLLHGLSQGDLQKGVPAATALRELLAYGDGCIWLAFHAGFDCRMLERAMRHHLGTGFNQTVFDVAALAPALFPDLVAPDSSLDYWAKAFALNTSARHSAAGDALLTAELTLVLLRQARRLGLDTWKQLADALREWQKRQDSNSGPMF